MSEPFAHLSQLQDRCDWDLTPEEERLAESALEDLSEEARYYGLSTWTAANAPSMVRTLVLRAAARYLRNPDGYVQSRAGDETVSWAEGGTPPAEFSKDEKQVLRTLSGKGVGGIYSVPLSAWRTQGPEFDPYVPSDTGKFPMFGEDGW